MNRLLYSQSGFYRSEDTVFVFVFNQSIDASHAFFALSSFQSHPLFPLSSFQLLFLSFFRGRFLPEFQTKSSTTFARSAGPVSSCQVTSRFSDGLLSRDTDRRRHVISIGEIYFRVSLAGDENLSLCTALLAGPLDHETVVLGLLLFGVDEVALGFTLDAVRFGHWIIYLTSHNYLQKCQHVSRSLEHVSEPLTIRAQYCEYDVLVRPDMGV